MPALNQAGRHKGLDLNPRLGQLTLTPKHIWERQMHELPLTRTTKDVGFGLARFASKDGTNARPGVRRLMWATGISDERTVAKALRELRYQGLIYLVEVGGGRGKSARADEYHLTTHNQVHVWTTTYEQWCKARSGQAEEGGDPWRP